MNQRANPSKACLTQTPSFTVNCRSFSPKSFRLTPTGLLSRGSALLQDSADHSVFWQSSLEQVGKHPPKVNPSEAIRQTFKHTSCIPTGLFSNLKALHFARHTCKPRTGHVQPCQPSRDNVKLAPMIHNSERRFCSSYLTRNSHV